MDPLPRSGTARDRVPPHGHLAARLRAGAPRLWRRLPRRRRRGSRWLAAANRRALDLGAPPVAEARMRDGHRLGLDLRSGTEWQAYYTGEFDDARVAVARRLLAAPGAVAVDAGANIGFWAVPLAARAAEVGGHVLAVEPLPANAGRLRANLARNGLDHRADVAQLALSDRPGMLALTLREDFAGGAATGNAALAIGDRGDLGYPRLPVPLVALDDLLAGHGHPDVRVIKADLEGHEDRFLAGAEGTLARCRPVAFLEWNRVYYERRGLDPTAAVTPLLRRLDYRCLHERDGDWVPRATFSSPRPVDDVVLAPAERVDTVRALLAAA